MNLSIIGCIVCSRKCPKMSRSPSCCTQIASFVGLNVQNPKMYNLSSWPMKKNREFIFFLESTLTIIRILKELIIFCGLINWSSEKNFFRIRISDDDVLKPVSSCQVLTWYPSSPFPMWWHCKKTSPLINADRWDGCCREHHQPHSCRAVCSDVHRDLKKYSNSWWGEKSTVSIFHLEAVLFSKVRVSEIASLLNAGFTKGAADLEGRCGVKRWSPERGSQLATRCLFTR